MIFLRNLEYDGEKTFFAYYVLHKDLRMERYTSYEELEKVHKWRACQDLTKLEAFGHYLNEQVYAAFGKWFYIEDFTPIPINEDEIERWEIEHCPEEAYWKALQTCQERFA